MVAQLKRKETTKLVFKTKKLTKTAVKTSVKDSGIKTIQVKAGNKTANTAVALLNAGKQGSLIPKEHLRNRD